MSFNETEVISAYINASLEAIKKFFNANSDLVNQAARTAAETIKKGGKILIFGNGGSAADAQHFACELVNRYLLSRKALPAIALSTDTSSLTAIGNDLGFEFVFARQIEALGNPGDLAIGISTSGKSQNVTFALKTAKNLKLRTIGITGGNGGDMPSVCDLCMIVAHDITPVIQQVHGMIIHLLSDLIERNICSAPEAPCE